MVNRNTRGGKKTSDQVEVVDENNNKDKDTEEPCLEDSKNESKKKTSNKKDDNESDWEEEQKTKLNKDAKGKHSNNYSD